MEFTDHGKRYILFHLVYLADAYGNSFESVVADVSDTLHVYGLTKADGTDFSFESEAWHLSDACTPESGIKYFTKRTELTVPVEFDN